MEVPNNDNVIQFKIKQKPISYYLNDLGPTNPKWEIVYCNITIQFCSAPIPNRFKRWCFGWFFGCKVQAC